MKSYRDLSEMGSVSGSIEKVIDDLGRVGLTSEEAEKFGSMLKKVAPELGSFGGSVSTGREKLVGLVQSMLGGETERAMARIGYGADEMRDATADYVKKQTNLGLAQGATQKELREGSVKYMESLRGLQELTGMQRDEAQKLMDEQQADARWALTLKRIEAEEGKDAADRARMGMAAFSAEFGKKSAAGLMEQIANRGAVAGELSAQIQVATNGEAMRSFDKLIRDKNYKISDLIVDTAQGVDTNTKRLSGSLMAAGTQIEAVTGDYQLVAGGYRNSERTRADTDKAIADIEKNAGKRLEDNVQNEQVARKLRIAADKALYEIGDLVIAGFKGLTEIMYKFAKAMAKTIDFMYGLIGKTTNYADQFKDADDFKNDIGEANKAKQALMSDLEKAKADLAQSEQQTADGKQAQNDLAKQIQEKAAAITEMEKAARAEQDISRRKILAADIAKEKRELNELNYQARAASKNGKIDNDEILAQRKKRVADLEAKNAETDKEILNAQKKLLEYQTKTGEGISGSGAEAGATGQQTNAQGQLVGQEQLEARKTAAAGLSQGVAGRTNDALSKLNFKNRTENTGGGEADPALIGLAEKISQAFPNSTFTALNDKFHKDQRQGSSHTLGKALDVVLNPAPKTPEEAAIFREKMKDLGANKVLDEYFANKSAGTTGGHFHAEVARDGGIFSGPQEGYPVILHGNEAVVPMPNLDNFVSDVKKDSLDSIKGMGTGNKEPIIQKIESGISPEFMNSMIEMMADKFDEMIRHLDNSHSTQEQILTYTKA